MAHPRQLIRKKAALMLTGATGAGTRVKTTALVPWHRTELPAASVYTLEESADDQDTGPRVYRRTLQLVIELGAEVTADIDDALDDLALQAETAMATDYTLGGLANDSVLTGTEVEITELGNKPIGFVRLNYMVAYYTDLSDLVPPVLNDFSTADVHQNLAGAQPTADQAHDVITDLEV